MGRVDAASLMELAVLISSFSMRSLSPSDNDRHELYSIKQNYGLFSIGIVARKQKSQNSFMPHRRAPVSSVIRGIGRPSLIGSSVGVP